MLIERSPKFISFLCKIKGKSEFNRIKKQILKIIQNPEVGKPMRFARKWTREVYIGSFRLSYSYNKEENKIIFLDLYHKDKQ